MTVWVAGSLTCWGGSEPCSPSRPASGWRRSEPGGALTRRRCALPLVPFGGSLWRTPLCPGADPVRAARSHLDQEP